MISYKPLEKTLIDKDLNKSDLIKIIGSSSATIAKFSKNEYVSLKIIDQICTELECEIEDVIKHIK